MIAATALVLMMTIPGLALFYAGMVRKKNVLATMAQSLAATALCSVLWVAVGYSLSFSGDAPALGTLDRVLLHRHGHGLDQSVRQDHPGSAVHDLPDDLRGHHGGACQRIGRRPHAVFGVHVVRRTLADRGLCADRALGLGRRISGGCGRARFRRRHRGAPQRRRRRHGRRADARRRAAATAAKTLRPTICRWR